MLRSVLIIKGQLQHVTNSSDNLKGQLQHVAISSDN